MKSQERQGNNGRIYDLGEGIEEEKVVVNK
jgi:hypothetical protein